MRTVFRMPVLILVGIMLMLLSSAVALAAPGGNSATAHACQKGGYKALTRVDGSAFRNVGECVSYAPEVGTPARLWIDVNAVEQELYLQGEGLLAGSDVFVTITSVYFPVPQDNLVGQADANGDYAYTQAYTCIFGFAPTTVTLRGTAVDGSSVTSETITPPCP